MLRKQIEIWIRKEKMLIWIMERKSVFHFMYTSLFSRFGGIVCQRVLWMSADLVLCKTVSHDSMTSALDLFWCHMSNLDQFDKLWSLLNFSKEYKTLLIQSRHGLVALLSIETENRECVREAGVWAAQDAEYRYTTYQFLDAKDSIQVKSRADENERKMHILHSTTCVVLDELESSYDAQYGRIIRDTISWTNFAFLCLIDPTSTTKRS